MTEPSAPIELWSRDCATGQITPSSATDVCPYCWGSHGCSLPADHDGAHECRHGHGDGQPDIRPRSAPDVYHYVTGEPEPDGTDGLRTQP